MDVAKMEQMLTLSIANGRNARTSITTAARGRLGARGAIGRAGRLGAGGAIGRAGAIGLTKVDG